MSRPNFKFLTLTDAEISSQKRIPLKCTKIGYFWTKIGPNGQNFEKRKENFRNTQKTNVHEKFQVSNPYRCWDIAADRHTDGRTNGRTNGKRTNELTLCDWIVALRQLKTWNRRYFACSLPVQQHLHFLRLLLHLRSEMWSPWFVGRTCSGIPIW